MVKVRTCECCGHPIPAEGIRGALTGLQLRIFDAVSKAGQAGVAVPRIMEVVYANDPNGGPESSNIVAVVRKKMEHKLTAYGLKISVRRGPGAIWRLEKL